MQSNCPAYRFLLLLGVVHFLELIGTKIELNEAKDQSITILITGKEKNVEEARTRKHPKSCCNINTDTGNLL
jgi:hypothetical protein